MYKDLMFLQKDGLSSAFRPKAEPYRFVMFDYKTKELIEKLPDWIVNEQGIYIITSDDNTSFIYPNGNSRVLYIGESTHIRDRLLEHRMGIKHNLDSSVISMGSQDFQRYHYMKAFGARVYIFYVLKKQVSKNLEAYVLGKFYERYHSLPVANGARSFTIPVEQK
jgi:hypothetical protein